VLTPSWTPLRITGTADRYVVEGRLVYPNAEEWNFVDVFELRNNRVIEVTEYFAAPFPAPRVAGNVGREDRVTWPVERSTVAAKHAL
jgi:hypothetical protein